jgi:hypothetical protein
MLPKQNTGGDWVGSSGERDGVSVRVRPVRTRSPFEKYRGIGSPGIAPGKKAVVEWVRKLRGR